MKTFREVFIRTFKTIVGEDSKSHEDIVNFSFEGAFEIFERSAINYAKQIAEDVLDRAKKAMDKEISDSYPEAGYDDDRELKTDCITKTEIIIPEEQPKIEIFTIDRVNQNEKWMEVWFDEFHILADDTYKHGAAHRYVKPHQFWRQLKEGNLTHDHLSFGLKGIRVQVTEGSSDLVFLDPITPQP